MCIASQNTQRSAFFLSLRSGSRGPLNHLRFRCLPLLLEHPKNAELLDVLVEAGESAWARGAHEVNYLALLGFVGTDSASKFV